MVTRGCVCLGVYYITLSKFNGREKQVWKHQEKLVSGPRGNIHQQHHTLILSCQLTATSSASLLSPLPLKPLHLPLSPPTSFAFGTPLSPLPRSPKKMKRSCLFTWAYKGQTDPQPQPVTFSFVAADFRGKGRHWEKQKRRIKWNVYQLKIEAEKSSSSPEEHNWTLLTQHCGYNISALLCLCHIKPSTPPSNYSQGWFLPDRCLGKTLNRDITVFSCVSVCVQSPPQVNRQLWQKMLFMCVVCWVRLWMTHTELRDAWRGVTGDLFLPLI